MGSFGAHEELQLLMLLVTAAALLLLADPLRIPYPILLVVGGLILGFAPGVPTVTLPPDAVIFGILPPLLYSAAFNTGLRDLKRNLRPISLLAIGLVALTMVAVAVAAHSVIGLSWPVSFVLGAVVSPTDPLAATSIARRLGVPRRAIAIVEGESLMNDGTALEVAASGSVGETTAPSTKLTGHESPITECAATATATIVSATSPIASSEIGPKVPLQVAQPCAERGRAEAESRRSPRRAGELVTVGTPGEAENEPADHEQIGYGMRTRSRSAAAVTRTSGAEALRVRRSCPPRDLE